jgi:ATP-dependent DNA ligase
MDAGTVEITSRPGIVTEFPIIEKELLSLNVDGYVFIGEMTLRGEKNRTKGNGIINSITEKVEKETDIIYTIWDMVPVQEFRMTKDEIKAAEKSNTLSYYEDRFDILSDILEKSNLEHVKLIETRIVKNMKEAYDHFHDLTSNGFEGTVIKAHDMTHKDGNSSRQLKVKLVIDAEVRCVGFIEGKKGTKREKTFGSLLFETDDGKISGSTSGFNDKMLEEINSNRTFYIGKVFTVEFNDITKAKDSKTYSFSHPRFVEFRDDKNSTDTLERCFEMKYMAMSLV